MDNNAVFILNEYRALQARERRDYAAAIHHSVIAAEAASTGDDAWGFCRMMFQAGQLQLDLGLIQDAVTSCRRLLESEAVRKFPEFESRTQALLSRIFHNDGQMQEALAVAREASSMSTQELSLDGRRRVQQVLVASLAEEGDIEAAWAEAMNLVAMLDGVTSPRIIGMTYWTVSNVAFMSSRVDEALENQRLAADALVRLDDVDLWAQFNKATAHVRLIAGLAGEETEEFVQRAEVAFAVVGGSEIDLYEIRITRAWFEFASGNAAVAEGLLRSLEKELAGPYPFLHARTLVILAQCLGGMGCHDEALECALQCERVFSELGADVFASESRELIDTFNRKSNNLTSPQ